MLFEANPEIDIREQSPLNLAFVGDGVFEIGRASCRERV